MQDGNTIQEQPTKAHKLPNNVRPDGPNAPALVWNDKDVLRFAALDASVPRTHTETHVFGFQLGSSEHARRIMALFHKHGQPKPTEWAVLQWVRRGVIPDRWRPTVYYLVMLEDRLTIGQVFRRARTKPAQPAQPASAA